MRDPKRIRRILKLFERIWTRMPDMRFGQMLWFIYGETGPPFYEEDEQPGEVTITTRLEYRLNEGDKRWEKIKKLRQRKKLEVKSYRLKSQRQA